MLFLAGMLLLAQAGCQNPLRPPVRIGVTSLDLSPVPPFLPKRILFQQDLEQLFHEPVVFDLMTPRQIRVHLGTGRVKFAMLTPSDYAEVAAQDNADIVAVPVNQHNESFRRGLIVVAPKSRFRAMSELKGVRFHSLQRGDILNEVAVGAMLEAGVQPASIDKGILGLELDTSHISSLEVAKSVAFEDNAAGVIDEADYNAWPEKGGSLLLFTPSKDQVRIIGRTVRVPEGPFLVSRETPADMREKVTKYMREEINRKKIVLGVLGVNGFADPVPAGEYEAYFAVHRKLVDTSKARSQPAR